jgi:cyclohexanone monooxygenase
MYARVATARPTGGFSLSGRAAQAASWIFGANIPGKKQTVMFYLGGIRLYRELLAAEKANGYPGFLTSAGALTRA